MILRLAAIIRQATLATAEAQLNTRDVINDVHMAQQQQQQQQQQDRNCARTAAITSWWTSAYKRTRINSRIEK